MTALKAESMLQDFEAQLETFYPSPPAFKLDSARRLTGPGLLWSYPGAVLDVFSDDPALAGLAKRWQQQLHHLFKQLDLLPQPTQVRHFQGGLNLALDAPMDQLYSAVGLAQLAWQAVISTQSKDIQTIPAELIDALQNIMREEASPRLIALLEQARAHDVDALCDDECLSLGHGCGAQVWPIEQLPDATQIEWTSLHDIPVALITGTNGKTTTTRLCFAIAKAAGLHAGLTSTDFVRVDDDILDRGDYSGPGGARMLLRDPRPQIAYLEVARGGILRRGLPLRRARTALVNNVAADHLGQYGVNTVPELAAAKFSVYRALQADGVLVLNADDPYVVAEASRTPARICWFSLHAQSPQIRAAIRAREACAWVEQESLMYFDGKAARSLLAVDEIPITLSGAARYNIANALAASCLSIAMTIPDSAIIAGLKAFRNDPADNPGRCNEFAVNGARVFVDFAHNPHSIDAVVQALAAMPANKRYLLLSHAGDRSDQDIRDVTRSALKLHPDWLVAAELEAYLRGREIGDVPQRIVDEGLACGLDAAQILRSDSPASGVKRILEQLQPGDVALLLVLAQREEIFELIDRYTL